MATRGLVGSCLLSLCATGVAAAQVVLIPPPVPILVPAPIPVFVGPPPAAVPVAEAPRNTDQRNYPPRNEAEPQRPPGQRVVHERHYISTTTNISNYMASKSGQTYGPETTLVIRDFYITDEPPPKKSPPPVGSAEDPKSTGSSPPKNSTDAQFDGMLDNARSRTGTTGGLNVPNPASADNGWRKNNGSVRMNYPPSSEEFIGPPLPPEMLASDTATSVLVASRNGGTPMAEMELNFVDLAGTHSDVKGKTDGKGQFNVRLAPSRWHVFLVVGDNERKSLGVILVKPTPGEPFKLQF